ncbi:flagellar biosynthesis protein R [Pannonibacter carbonis]|uniref:flagellar biosynthesis protein R n=1 Tax=Pannonibacter carbonis TaxID=2067569 RepID=UPI000D0E853B|nr:flagellar biosynthesis protein R [Pannonibacter carbonis]
MSKNAKEIGRILKLQRQIHQLSAWMLVNLDRQDEQLAEKQERVLKALSEGDLALQDRFIRNASQRLKTIAEEQARLSEAREKVEAEMARQGRMLKVTERRLATVARLEHQAGENRRLADILERYINTEAQASRKLDDLVSKAMEA